MKKKGSNISPKMPLSVTTDKTKHTQNKFISGVRSEWKTGTDCGHRHWQTECVESPVYIESGFDSRHCQAGSCQHIGVLHLETGNLLKPSHSLACKAVVSNRLLIPLTFPSSWPSKSPTPTPNHWH